MLIEPFKVITEDSHIRVAKLKDIPSIIAFYHSNQEHFARFSDLKPTEFYTEEYWIQEIEKREAQFKRGNECKLFILSLDEKEIIGYCNFFNVMRGAFDACFLGYGLAKTAVGKGLMQKSLIASCEAIFKNWNLHRIMANYDPENKKSENTLSAVGFVQEGYARDYLYYHGKWHDHVMTSLINKNWKISS